MTITTAYHVGNNTPGYTPESDVTCWDTAADAREALLTAMFDHVDQLGDVCDCGDVDPKCDDCDVYDRARKITEDTAADTAVNVVTWREGLTVYLPTGRALPLAFWLEPVQLDHVAECEPLTD